MKHDTPALRGQIKQVRHLVEVTPVEEELMARQERQRESGSHNLAPAPGSHRNRKRLGRGPGSGTGKTSGKGHKGIKARAGHHGPAAASRIRGRPDAAHAPRCPKRGFTNPFRSWSQTVGPEDARRRCGGEVTRESLAEAGLIRTPKGRSKLLANGEIPQAVTVRGLEVSAGARGKIVAAGGRVEE